MSKPRASQVTDDLEKALEQIVPANGYGTEIKAVFRAAGKVKDAQPKPYILLRVATDTRTGGAVQQASRLRTFELQVVFSHAAEDEELDQAHRDILRCVGFGEVDFDRRLPGLFDEPDEATYEYPAEGSKTRSVTVQLGVTYVENYARP